MIIPAHVISPTSEKIPATVYIKVYKKVFVRRVDSKCRLRYLRSFLVLNLYKNVRHGLEERYLKSGRLETL